MSHSKRPTDPRQLMNWVDYHHRQSIKNTGTSGDGTNSYGQTGGTGTGGPAEGTTRQNPDGSWSIFFDGSWLPFGNNDTGDTGTTGVSGGYSGQPLSEQLALLEAKYGWDSKLELEVLMKEYEQRGLLEKELIGINFENQKWLTDRGYAHDVSMADLSQKHKLEYLNIEIGLTKDMKLELMAATHGYDIIKMDKQFDFDRIENATNREFTAEQSGLDRDLKSELAKMDIKAREALQAAQIAAEQAMQQAGFSHTEKMQAASQAFDEVMQSRGFAHDFAIQAKDLAMRLLVSNNQIKSQEKIAENTNKHQKEMQATQIAFDKEQKEEDRKLRRFEEVQKLRGKDPVRAALMAMGAGDALDQFGGSFADLGPMEGADKLKTDTESALQGIEGLGAPGSALTLGDTGVEGLQSVEKAGTAFVTSGSADDTAVKTLIRSAQGVGGSTQSGVSESQVRDRIAAITPKGFEQRAAAGGVGPQLSPMNAYNKEYAARGRGDGRSIALPTANAPTAVATTRPAVEPNTSYTVGEGERGDGSRPEVVTTGPDKELLSIEPASDETKPVEGRGHGDPLVDMFNDPKLKLGRSETEPGKPDLAPVVAEPTAPPVDPVKQKQVDDFKVRMDTQFKNEMAREGINEADMAQIKQIRDSGQPLSPEQEKALNRYEQIVKGYEEANNNYRTQILGDQALAPMPGAPGTPPVPGQPTGPGIEIPIGQLPPMPRDGGYGGNIEPHRIDPTQPGARQLTPEMIKALEANPGGIDGGLRTMGPESLAGRTAQQTREIQLRQAAEKQAYLASLPPAQQAALKQTQRVKLRAQQDQLAGSLTPETIQKLMGLINNPAREVDKNLNEVLPQLRDGAGNLTNVTKRLASVV